MTAIGIEIGGTKLQSAVVDAEGIVHLRHSAVVDPAAGAAGVREALAGQLAALLADWREDSRRPLPGAAGVGFGGPVDRTRGIVAASFHVSGWHDFPLRQ